MKKMFVSPLNFVGNLKSFESNVDKKLSPNKTKFMMGALRNKANLNNKIEIS